MSVKRKKPTENLVLAAMFLAIGLVLPFLTGQIQEIGSALLPMHLPVLVCGLICGWKWGALVGAVLPTMRYILFGMPAIYPTGMAMSAELATYGLVAGWIYGRSRWQCVWALYRALITAMIAGRLVWGVVRVLQSGVAGTVFTWKIFLSSAVLGAVPGIILQLVFIPALMVAMDRTGVVRFRREKSFHPAAECP